MISAVALMAVASFRPSLGALEVGLAGDLLRKRKSERQQRR
jgi:hypothetical protein